MINPFTGKSFTEMLTRQTEGREQVITSAALEYVMREELGGEVYAYLMNKFMFAEWLDKLRNTSNYLGTEDTEYNRARIAQLKEDLKDGHIEIKVTFEYKKVC